MKNPELIDPIYQELLKETKVYTDMAVKLRAEADAAKVEWEKADVKSGRARAAKNRYYSKLKEAEHAHQKSLFYELRANSRRLEARKLYIVAFEKDIPWPDPAEYEAYQDENRLKKSNMSWDARAPKWSKRKSANKSQPEEAEKSAGSGGGGHH